MASYRAFDMPAHCVKTLRTMQTSLSLRLFPWVLCFTVVALSACSRSGFDDDVVVGRNTGDGFGDGGSEIVPAYLSGEVTLEEFAKELMLPEPTVMSAASIRNISQEARVDLDEAVASLEEMVANGHDSSNTERQLSLDHLAGFFAASEVKAGRPDLDEHFEKFDGPLWWTYALTQTGDSFHEYFRNLWNAHYIESFRSPLMPLLTLHMAIYDEVYCVERAGVNIDGMLELLVLELQADGNEPIGELTSEIEIRRRIAAAGLEHGEVVKSRIRCVENGDRRLWPLPYDLDQAFEIRRAEIRRFLETYVANSKESQPDHLTIVE